jgi:hypothetical protein
LAGLQTAKLRSAADGPPPGIPDLKDLDETQGSSLANTLAAAMDARRKVIKDDPDDDELDSDDPWSD